MRVLLVGLGRWGEKHLRVLAELGVTVWAADVSAERRAWAVSRGLDPARVVADHRAALDVVDAVDVVTPADTHLDVAGAALEVGRHCFVEKPLAVTVEDAQRLAARAARAGRVLQVGHIFRFHPVTLALRAALVAGRIGSVRFATARFSGFKRPRTDVGVTHADAIHYFDLLAFVLDRSPDRVAAVQRDWLGRGLDDMSLTVVHYGDVVAVVEANYFVPGTHRECVVVGERGSLVADYGAGTLTLHAGEHRRGTHGWEAVDAGKETLATTGVEPLRAELAAFLDACAGRSACPVTAEDGVRALQVVEAAAQAARRGESVELRAE
ncbi:MAG: Gfo/Idh/MocA family oxidoreductase [Candidatus Rokubacteria bacterium]|nr:Gfo/Idh/MocA family oxidoreductase [Candidatus Rokubacteria bacterium]